MAGPASGGRAGPQRRPARAWPRPTGRCSSPAAGERTPSRWRRRVAFEAPRAGVPAGAVTVDHGLQPGSADAGRAHRRRCCATWASTRCDVVRVDVGRAGGPEAAARTARYAALRTAAAEHGARIALGHTLDDQAETVLLGLGRGSGPRSVAGMVGASARRSGARCSASGGRPPGRPAPRWSCPSGTTRGTTDPAYTRVRLRTEVLPLLEDVLGGGVGAGAGPHRRAAPRGPRPLDALAAAELDRLPADGGAARRRSWPRCPPRCAGGCCAAGCARGAVPDLQAVHLAAVDALLTALARAGPGRPAGRRGRRPGVWQAGRAAPGGRRARSATPEEPDP